MDYFKKYPRFSILKNFILKDSLSDWFEIHSDKYERDEDTLYNKMILNNSIDFKNQILKWLLEKSNLDIPLTTDFGKTKELIDSKSPLILQGILLNKYDIFVNCDIIIQYSLFKKLFPMINNIPFHLYCTDTDYMLIDLSFSNLHFNVDLKDINNDGIILYKKCKLNAFRDVFYELTGDLCQCFIMSKNYYYKNELLPKNEFISKVKINDMITNTYIQSLKWIRYLRKNHHTMTILPEPSEIELYPNMNYSGGQWEKEKSKLAEKIKEITLVWNISYDDRCNYIEKGITKWNDPQLLKELKETKNTNIQERMIHMNQQNDILIHPRKNISQELINILDPEGEKIFFDVESFLSFDDKKHISIDEIKNPMIAIIGYIYNNHFYDHTINSFSKKDEEIIIKRFANNLKKISKNKIINIYHWGHAEKKYFDYIHKNYKYINFPEYKLIDILDYFRMEPIIVQGIFKFGLKYVGKSLYQNNLIKTTWEDYDNGLDTMINFKEYCINHNKKIPIKRFLEVEKIINYNRIDCQVLYEIFELLKEKYGND
jgi:hypothetical protein